jgi:ribA/ribD-fused uncharacterized protein
MTRLIDTFSGEYAFLSNFYHHTIEENGLTYPTNEHYFQSKKTLFPDESEAIRVATTPTQAKYYGYNHCTLRPDWEAIKIQVMRDALELKFPDSKSAMGQKLLYTGIDKLVEGNFWHDNFWGVCDGKGKNWLGHLLMARRAELLA